MGYKCLIIDDEKPARELITEYVHKIPELELVATCKSAMEAQTHLQNTNIDVLFTDIQMPEISGLDFLRMLKNVPATVLITAHPDFAVEGFDLDVIDYVLKPVEFSRFYKAVAKVLAHLKPQQAEEPSGTNKHVEDDKHIFVKADKEILKLNISEILYIESIREYVQIHTIRQKVVTLQSLSKFESILPEKAFYRVHRSYIVNVNHIDSIMGNSVVIREKLIPISRGQRQAFLDRINKNKLF